MNAKKCKALRKQARELSIGKPARGLIVKKKKSDKGWATTTAVNHPDTTREIYLKLKRAA